MTDEKSESTPTICIIGAGFSGICAAIQVQKQLQLKSFTLFDGNEDVGGTWLVNKYPGCACDVQSHLYSYSFEKNPGWSLNYSPQPEIWNYLQKVAQKYDIYPHIKFNTDVKLLKWDESIKRWRVTIEYKSGNKGQGQELLFDIVINASGRLRAPNIPEQFKAFKGPLMHSAQWDTNISLENKTVAVVGSGASAIQIIPAIAPKVKTLHVYQRKPAWIIRKSQFHFPKGLKLLFAYLPVLMLLFRAAIFFLNELLLRTFHNGHFFSRAAVWLAKVYRNKSLNYNTKLASELTPGYAFGCKRTLLSDNYYQAMARPNVRLHRVPIETVTEDSIITKGGEGHKIDILVLATGFKVQDYFAPMEIYGLDGANILEIWKQSGPSSYYGIVGSKLPNLFTLLGPNTGLGHNSAIFQLECQANFVMSVIKEMEARSATKVLVKARSEQEFMDCLKEGMKKTVWGNVDCGSWYADARGEVTALWPKSCTEYWNQTRVVDFNAFTFE